MPDKKQKGKKDYNKKVNSTIRLEGRGKIKSDTDGSYTGTAENNGKPVQDADDL